MARRLYGLDADEFSKAINDLPRGIIEESLVDMYEQLFCNEDGEFNPTDSTAGDSASDFVEACNYIIQRLERGEQQCETPNT